MEFPVPAAGLALIGFMAKERAVQYLRDACMPFDSSDHALETEWAAAVAQLGAPYVRAGLPDIQPIPASHQGYISQLAVNWPNLFAQGPVEFKMVEAKPLLAFQISVDGSRSGHHCAAFGNPPTVDELFETCLPQLPTEEPLNIQQQHQSIIIKAKSLNVRTQANGMVQAGTFGIQIGLALPFVHVVRYDGRCYLHNGFHRMYGAAAAGATHIPCLFRDVASPQEAGIQADGSTFDLEMLTSANPPTVAHFVDGRAHTVALKATTRILHVSWAEYGMYDE